MAFPDHVQTEGYIEFLKIPKEIPRSNQKPSTALAFYDQIRFGVGRAGVKDDAVAAVRRLQAIKVPLNSPARDLLECFEEREGLSRLAVGLAILNRINILSSSQDLLPAALGLHA